MTITKLTTAALASAMLAAMIGGAAAQSASDAPNAAYFTVDLHACAAVPSIVLAGTGSALEGDAALVHDDVLMGTYGGNCEAFHANEVLPRLFLHEGS